MIIIMNYIKALFIVFFGSLFWSIYIINKYYFLSLENCNGQVADPSTFLELNLDAEHWGVIGVT